MKPTLTVVVFVIVAVAAMTTTAPAFSQEPVVAAANPEALFTDKDPVLHARKQVVLHVLRELLQCNYWDQAAQYLSERYIQHHPAVQSGRANIVEYFSAGARTPTCEKLTLPIVTVLTSDDIVGVVFKMEHDHPTKPGTKYTTIWYDQWRVVNGRADEHWDISTLDPLK